MRNKVCRVAFCEKCHAKRYPLKGQLFLTIGSTGTPTVHRVDFESPDGFTPHIFHLHHRDFKEKKYTVFSSCAINGCDTTLKRLEDNKFEIIFEHTEVSYWSPQWWRNLVKFTDTGYELD